MDGNSGVEGAFVLVLVLLGMALWVMLGYSRSRRARGDAGGAGDLGSDGDCGDGGDGGGGD